MAENPEALAQLARLLGESGRHSVTSQELRTAADQKFDALTDGLLDEAAASDDVTDRDSALSFLEKRLQFFEGLLSREQIDRLSDALRDRVEKW